MRPLADILRPQNLQEFIGQTDLVNPNWLVAKMIQNNKIFSHIYWGPPASGKTTLAKIIASNTESDFFQLSAVTDGKEELKKVIKNAQNNNLFQKNTILFIDEIHRWNKAQQDALLPFVEDGTVTLIGATTQNPSFTINNALLSRTRVFVLQKPSAQEVREAISRGLKHLGKKMPTESQQHLAKISDGDMRFALNTLEILNNLGNFSTKSINSITQKTLNYDRDGEEHYNLISAVHKSLRSSNPTASIYWVCRMLHTGEDPLYIARRLLRFASEDIGNSNPNALLLANQVYEAVQKLGMPEAEIFLVQLAHFLANCSKDNSVYIAQKEAHDDIQNFGATSVPLHFRNAPTKLMKDLNYGKNYQYDHDLDSKKSNQECLPTELQKRNYFTKKPDKNTI